MAALGFLVAFGNSGIAQAESSERLFLAQLLAESQARHEHVQVTQTLCDDFSNEIFPALNALGLSKPLSAEFRLADKNFSANCRVRYGNSVIFSAHADHLGMKEDFDRARIAKTIVEKISYEDSEKLRAGIPDYLNSLFP